MTFFAIAAEFYDTYGSRASREVGSELDTRILMTFFAIAIKFHDNHGSRASRKVVSEGDTHILLDLWIMQASQRMVR